MNHRVPVWGRITVGLTPWVVASSVAANPMPLAVVSAERAREALYEGGVMIDVRARQPFEARTVKGAVHLPCLAKAMPPRRECSDALASAVGDPTRPLVVFAGPRDRSGQRAAQAVRRLGYRTVYWMRGGITEWTAKGLHTQ